MKAIKLKNDQFLVGKSPEVVDFVGKAHNALPDPFALVVVPVEAQPANAVTVRVFKAGAMQESVVPHLPIISQGIEGTPYQDATGIEGRTFVIDSKKATAKA